MTFDPRHDLVEMTVPIPTVVCECGACVHAGVTEPPNVERVNVPLPGGGWKPMQRRLHGADQQRHIAARDRFRKAAEARGIALGELVTR